LTDIQTNSNFFLFPVKKCWPVINLILSKETITKSANLNKFRIDLFGRRSQQADKVYSSQSHVFSAFLLFQHEVCWLQIV